MTKKLQKKIKRYSALLGVILTTEKVNGQVIYMDIIPDDTLPNNSMIDNFPIDIDQNGINDFNFRFNTFFHLYSSWTIQYEYTIKLEADSLNFLFTFPLSTSFLNCTPHLLQSQFKAAYPFNPGDTIPDQSGPISPSQTALIENWAHYEATWTGGIDCFNAIDSINQDKCIGFILSDGSINRYGWMRVELLNESVILKDYAYQSQPDIPILACDLTDLSTGISENNLQLNFSQQNNSIHISSFQNLNHANICVYGLLGKEILRQPFEGKEATIKIDKKGIYFVEVKSEKGIYRKKVFIY